MQQYNPTADEISYHRSLGPGELQFTREGLEVSIRNLLEGTFHRDPNTVLNYIQNAVNGDDDLINNYLNELDTRDVHPSDVYALRKYVKLLILVKQIIQERGPNITIDIPMQAVNVQYYQRLTTDELSATLRRKIHEITNYLTDLQKLHVNLGFHPTQFINGVQNAITEDDDDLQFFLNRLRQQLRHFYQNMPTDHFRINEEGDDHYFMSMRFDPIVQAVADIIYINQRMYIKMQH